MGRILVRGEDGHDIVQELYPEPGEPVVDKPGKGAFYATDLDAILQNRGITQLVVCGVTTEVCVNTTVREANDRGYDCLVLEDCVASYFPEFQKAALAMIKAQGGIFGWVVGFQALPRRSGHRAVDREAGGLMASATTNEHPVRWWVPGDWNGFFGLFTNVLLNVIVLTGLCLGVVKLPGRYRVRPHPAGARHRAAARQPVLRLPRLAAGEERGAQRRHGDALRPERAAHVHRRLPDHAADLPEDQATRSLAWQAGLAWCFIIGVIVLLGAFVGPTIREVHAARGDARHAGRHLDRLHLDAAGVPDAGRCRGSAFISLRASC